LKDLKKYESVPDRQEPYDPQMHAAAQSLAAQCSSNTLLCALTDGFEQGYCAGYSLSEWAQPSMLGIGLIPYLLLERSRILTITIAIIFFKLL
jgi:hypothetical protein